MKRQFFRITLIATTVLSVAMMGIALSVFVVRPDLSSEMNTPAMQNFTFARTTDDPPKWTVTPRFGTKTPIGTYETAYEALIKAHQNLKQSLDAEAGPMQTQKTALEQQATAATQLQVLDEQAVAALALRLRGRPADHPEGGVDGVLPALDSQLLALSTEVQGLSVKSREIRDETAARRTDVLRLRHELEEARTDLFRLQAVQRDLTDRAVRLEIENQELADRRAQVTGKTTGYEN
jgi:hypothetical protein